MKAHLEISMKAVREYERVFNEIKETEELLKTKKFQMGTIVTNVTASRADMMFGVSSGNVGKIIGWDEEYGYYRVYYSERNPYVGVREEKLELFNGEVPEAVLNYDPYNITQIVVDL